MKTRLGKVSSLQPNKSVRLQSLLICLPIAIVCFEGSALTVEEVERWATAHQGRFLLSGTVVDENGTSLNGVTVKLVKGSGTKVTEPVRLEEESRVINGSFSFDLRPYDTVQLTFALQGYYEQKVIVSMPEPRISRDQLMGLKPIPEPTLVKNDLHVVLYRRGQVMELLDYREVLEYSANSSGAVIDFDRPHYLRRSVVRVQNLTDPNQLPPNCVYMVADVDSDGKIAVVQTPRSNSSIVDVVPQRLRLIMNHINGGFVETVLDPNKPRSLQMKEAPLVGYKKEVVVGMEDFVAGGCGGGALFYFRTKDKYGKGATGWVKVDQNRTNVKLGAVFSVQPDGSRNLETEPDRAELTIEVTGTVSSGDTIPPSITVSGDNPASVECGGAYTDAGATASDDTDGNLTASITVSNTVNTAAVGQYTVTYSVKDAAGNPATATRTVNVADTTKPQISCPTNMSVGCDVRLEVPVTFTATATDACDSSPTVTCSPVSGSGFRVGTATVNCTARDASGNSTNCSFTVTRAALGFTGFLAPVGGADATGGSFANPIRTFKLGSKIPVKFTASCNGAAVDSGLHTLQVIKWSNETTAETPIDASPADAATTGNQFRWATDHWQYVLDTQATAMSIGTWELRATLSDGSTHSAFIAIK